MFAIKEKCMFKKLADPLMFFMGKEEELLTESCFFANKYQFTKKKKKIVDFSILAQILIC